MPVLVSSTGCGVIFPVDLHCHTTVSDGEWAPMEVITAARNAGIEVLALTDHDAVGDPSLVGAAHSLGLQLIAGIELMCTTEEGQAIDIVGLDIDWSDPRVTTYSRAIEEGLREWTEEVVRRLPAVVGGDWDLQEWTDRLQRQSLHEGDLYFELAHRGHFVLGLPFAEFRDRYTGPGRPLHFRVPGKLTPAAGVKWLHDMGGLAVLTLSEVPRHLWDDLANTLAAAGCDAIEARHPNLSFEDENRAWALSAQNAMLVTGGSDFHGPYRGSLGEQGLTRREAEAIVSRMSV